MYKLVLLRHGESVWNKKNLFTGWTDVDLSPEGEVEAHTAGKLLRDEGYTFDIAYTSVLKRAIRTLWIALEELDQCYLPIINSWRLNERHYGALQGLDKAEVLAKYGEEQFTKWRRGYDTPPQPLTDETYQKTLAIPAFNSVPREELPRTECLKDVVARFLPYWNGTIAPTVKQGKKVIIAGHGNSLRALVKYLDDIPENEITELNIPTGIPLVYELDDNLKPLKHYYLGDPEVAALKAAAVANQAKK